MKGLELGDTLDQAPRVLFETPNNKYFFSREALKSHQEFINIKEDARTVKAPLTGDIFETPNGKHYSLVVMQNLNTFQLTELPGYTYVNGLYRSYSGGYAFETEKYWTSLDKLELTEDVKRVNVWSFLNGSSGAQKGVKWSMRVPVWRLKRLK